MKKYCVKKAIFCLTLLAFTVSGCAPLIPDNYLRSSSIASPQKINGKWVQPRLIPISAEMLSSPQGKELLEPAMRPQPYRIGAFDAIDIIVWGHPEISTIATPPLLNNPSSNGVLTVNSSNTPILVQTDGSIFFPYVGHLQVAGSTVVEVQNKIAERLNRYVRNPQVTVQVARYRNRNVYVLGEVKTPGMQPLTDKPLTIMEALTLSGNINSDSADPMHIFLVRGSYQKPDIYWLNATSPQSLMIASAFPVQENDIIYVSGATLNPWNKFINQVLPTFTAYFIARDIGK